MPPVSLTVLGSGSKGNSTLISSGDENILVDAGFSMRELTRRIELAGKKPEDITAIILTHTHRDHAQAVTFSFALKYEIPVHFHKKNGTIFRHFYDRFPRVVDAGFARPFTETPVEIGEIIFEPYRLPHDSRGVHNGFRITFGGEKVITYATDLGFFPKEYYETFADSDLMMIKSNHDLVMLEESDRPYYLKKRIRGNRGHLSNDQTMETLGDLLGAAKCTPGHIVFAHLSEECNHPDMVSSAVEELFSEKGFKKINYHIACQDELSEEIVID